MKYILIKDLPPVFVPGADKEVFVKDGKVYINAMFNGLIGTLEDCLASGFVKEVKEKVKVKFYLNVVINRNNGNYIVRGIYNTRNKAEIDLAYFTNETFIGTHEVEIEVEE